MLGFGAVMYPQGQAGFCSMRQWLPPMKHQPLGFRSLLGLAVLGAFKGQGGSCGVGQWLPPMPYPQGQAGFCSMSQWLPPMKHQPLGFRSLLGLAVLGAFKGQGGSCGVGQWLPPFTHWRVRGQGLTRTSWGIP